MVSIKIDDAYGQEGNKYDPDTTDDGNNDTDTINNGDNDTDTFNNHDYDKLRRG